MSWKRKIGKALAVIAVFALVLLMFMLRTDGDISCLYTTF